MPAAGRSAVFDRRFARHVWALVRVYRRSPDARWAAVEKQVYELIAERLPRATVVSIAHRPGVERYHERRWVLAPAEGRVSLEAA